MKRFHAGIARTATIAGLLALVLTAHGTTPASAQSTKLCMPRADLLMDQLGKQYGEVLTAAGVDANGNFVQVYSSDDKGTWTIAVTIPGGPTCVISAGEGWVREQTAELRDPGQSS